jgi:hypothetical protein
VSNIDPANGLKIHWASSKSVYGGPRHSLVEVPRTIPIILRYHKPERGLEFQMKPTEDDFEWTFSGIIDPGIVQGMELHVAQRSQYKSPPILNAKSYAVNSRFGKFVLISEENQLIEVDLRLPIDRLYDLLHFLWKPSESYVPKYFLGGPKWDHRLLPQKCTSRATLVVKVLPNSTNN